MFERDPEPVVVKSAGELALMTTRRRFLHALGAGTAIALMPSVFTACNNDDYGIQPGGTGAGQINYFLFDLRTDVGILQLTHTLEIVEGAFYTAVVNSANFSTFFSADEREVLTDIRNTEVIHREFLRNALGAQAVTDFSGQFNQAVLTQLLSSRDSILSTAKTFESTGVATLNGAGKYLKDVRNLLAAGKLASVEARHLAALRDIAPPAGGTASTAFAADDSIDATGRDIKNEAQVALSRLKATGLISDPLNFNLAIVNTPDPIQGSPTADQFPAIP